jgi:hypothetical protein
VINFEKYDNENPQIWEAFKKYAIQARDRGFKNYSTNGIFEIIRWHTAIEGNDTFKINDRYRPDYARKMMNLYPDFDGFFRTRELKAERVSEIEYEFEESGQGILFKF